MNEACPIWGTPADTWKSTLDGKFFDSPRAGGRFFVSGTAQAVLKNTDDAIRVSLTTWIIDQHRLGVAVPKVFQSTIKELRDRSSLSVHDRADCLLRYLRSKTDLLGQTVNFYALDNTRVQEVADELLGWTASRKISEVITLAEYCSDEGWIEHQTVQKQSKNNLNSIMLRPPGYTRLAELDGTNSSSSQAFVAMWFDDSMKDAYEQGIAPGIQDAGYNPIRIDRKEHNNKIDDEIIAEIRRSRFVVADFTQGETGARGGVYYEAGFAHGLGIPTIFTCREDGIDNVHFDTRQYNHITWTTFEGLRTQLAQRIEATIGDGPKRKTNDG